MFKPHRFDPALKAVPNEIHRSAVANKASAHGYHDHLAEGAEEVDITKKTTTVSETVATAHGVEEVAVTKEATTRAHVHGTAEGAEGVAVTKEKTTRTHVKATADGAEGVTVTTASTTLESVHETIEGIADVELTPPHPPREETPAYAKAHHHLTYVLDSPCAICGVKNSTLKDPKENPFGAKALETHHYPVERSLLDACDPVKVGHVFTQVKDRASMEAFVDTEANLIVLCDIHHRHPHYGIHHLPPQDFYIQPFLIAGYEVAATRAEAAAVMAKDEALIEAVAKQK